MFLRWTPEPSDWHLLQQILVSFLCGEPTWRFFWSVRLELFGNSLTICSSHYSTGHVCYLVRRADLLVCGIPTMHLFTLSPHIQGTKKNKNLVSLFLPTVWLCCEILLLVSSIIYVYSLRPCCRRAGLWHVSHFVYDDGFWLRLSRKTSDMNLM